MKPRPSDRSGGEPHPGADSGSETICRLFVAIPLEATLKQALQQRIAQLDALPARIAWVRPEGIHLTLAFIGDTFEARLRDCAEAIDAAADGIAPFAFAVDGLGDFGRGRTPRVIWAGIPSPPEALIRLQARTADFLRAAGMHIESRPFVPHITLGRVRGVAAGTDLRRALDPLRDTGTLGVQRTETVALVQSRLGPRGAAYEVRHTTPLQGKRN